jgi:hypothetical protein
MSGKADYWSEMKPMPDYKKLVDYVRSLNIPLEILTAGAGEGDIESYVRIGKQKWCKKHGLGDLPFNIVLKGIDKNDSKFAKKGHMLIDDKKENLTAFGKLGVLHTSASSSIAKVKKLV